MTSTWKTTSFLFLLFSAFGHTLVHSWHCGNGDVIDETLVCDGIFDCNDRSDEHHCGQLVCSDGFFMCHNHLTCVTGGLKCNGYDDCGDGSDENDCENDVRSYCEKDHFRCKNDECTPQEWVCDGEKDCSDGSDEQGCLNAPAICPDGDITCNSTGICIKSSWVCDGEGDCEDGGENGLNDEDERNCSGLNLSTTASSTISATCMLRKNLTFWNEEDYEGMVVCDQKCSQTSYLAPCQCLPGYMIKMSNPLQCQLDNYTSPYLYFAAADRIVRRNLRHAHDKELNVNAGTGSQSLITSLDYDEHAETLVWVDHSSGQIYSWSEQRNVVEVVVDIPGAVGLALDWLTPNLYIAVRPTAGLLGYVAVLPLKRSMYILRSASAPVVIGTFALDPVSVAVYPGRGVMMVVDQNLGQSPSKIVKADMNGQHSEDFVIEYNRQIHCVVIDYVTEVVYWTESSRLHGSRIEMKSMDGSQKRTLVTKEDKIMPLVSPISLSCYEDRIVFSDNVTQEIWEVESMRGKPEGYYQHKHKPLKALTSRLLALHVSHPSLQPVSSISMVCRSARCSYMCVLKPHGYSCLCPASMELAVDQRTCVDVKSPVPSPTTASTTTLTSTTTTRIAPRITTERFSQSVEVVAVSSAVPSIAPLCSYDNAAQSRGTAFYSVGYLMVVTCQPGKHFRGSSKTTFNSTCLSSGKWSDAIPDCVSYTCEELNCGRFGKCTSTDKYNAVCACFDGTMTFLQCPKAVIVTTSSTIRSTTTSSTIRSATTSSTIRSTSVSATSQPATISTSTNLPNETTSSSTSLPKPNVISADVFRRYKSNMVAALVCMTLVGVVCGCLLIFCCKKHDFRFSLPYAKQPTPLKKLPQRQTADDAVGCVRMESEPPSQHCISNPTYSSPKTRIRLKPHDDMADSGLEQNSVSTSSEDSPHCYTYSSLATASPTGSSENINELNVVEDRVYQNEDETSPVRPGIRSAITGIFKLRKSESQEAMLP